MEFKELFATYIETLGCTAKDLAETSGLSAATVSRYRSGERIPKPGTEEFAKLVRGITLIAIDRRIADITERSVSAAFSSGIRECETEIKNLRENFNTLLNVFPVNVSALSRFLNFDPSYISRIRNGQRQPASPTKFAWDVADFVARRLLAPEQLNILASLTGYSENELTDCGTARALLAHWLLSGHGRSETSLSAFLKKMDEFDLNAYIRVIHFDELDVPSARFSFPVSKNYFGLKKMMDSELAFLKATVLSDSTEPVIMYSDMPIHEMAKDPEFPKKWMLGMTLILKKGLHIHNIHSINRPLDEMMLALKNWIPMYMTGQISPYYLRGTQNGIFSHLLKVSGSAALTGEAIRGCHSDGKYHLTTSRSEIAYYQKQAHLLLSKALPLMDIYPADREAVFHLFLRNDSAIPGKRCSILSTLPIHTITDDLLDRILKNNNVSRDGQSQIKKYVDELRKITAAIGEHSSVTEEIPVLTKEDFEESPLTLSLSGIFFEKDIFYTWEEYQEHLRMTADYQRKNSFYHTAENTAPAFKNIQIHIHRGKWVTVSKNSSPAIHFLIRHPKILRAFENMVIPVIES